MPVSKAEWSREKKRLAYVLRKIEERLARQRLVVQRGQVRVQDARASMWQDLPHQVRSFDDVIKMNQGLEELRSGEREESLHRRSLMLLEKLADSPYFGRVDFREDGAVAPLQVYVGIASFYDEEGEEYLIYDWRAPISSMFYDSEPGRAEYQCPEGVIKGELLLKRQYKIRRGQIEYMFDSSLKIDDEMLAELMARHADGRMRSIVLSIQRQQNQIIRDTSHRLLIVQGVAGSGKTSVALHRVAYLLYAARQGRSSLDGYGHEPNAASPSFRLQAVAGGEGVLRPENIVVFSPNSLFSEYVSEVLPELGEENMRLVTFPDCARKLLGAGVEVEDMPQHLGFVFAADETGDSTRLKAIRYKASDQFAVILGNYLQRLLSGQLLSVEDMSFNGEVIMSREEILERYRHGYSHLSAIGRLQRIRNRIQQQLSELKEKRFAELVDSLRAELEEEQPSEWQLKRIAAARLKEELDPLEASMAALVDLSPLEVYARLFRDKRLYHTLAAETDVPEGMDEIRAFTLACLDRGHLLYEDLAPLMFLWLGLAGAPGDEDVRHVIVDEAQDYSLLQYKVIRKLFPKAGLTVLGDLDQAIHPVMNVGTYDRIIKVFGSQGALLLQLTRSYRNTRQISAFAAAILGGQAAVEPAGRSGCKPKVSIVEDAAQLDRHVALEVRKLRRQSYQSVAVICKTSSEAQRVCDLLASTGGRLISGKAGESLTGVVVIPLYLAKGLEFDAVIIWDAARYNTKERRLLYIACTRALHYLHVYSTGLRPPLSEVDKGLYDSDTGSQ